jgi:hypothetical protein
MVWDRSDMLVPVNPLLVQCHGHIPHLPHGLGLNQVVAHSRDRAREWPHDVLHARVLALVPVPAVQHDTNAFLCVSDIASITGSRSSGCPSAARSGPICGDP